MAGLQRVKKKIAFFLLLSMLVAAVGLPAIAEDDTSEDEPANPEQIVVHTDVEKLKIGEGDVLTINSWLSGTTKEQTIPVVIDSAFDGDAKIILNGSSITSDTEGTEDTEDTTAYRIKYPANGRQVSFSVAIKGKITGVKSGQNLGTISIGGDTDTKAVIKLYYSDVKTVDKIITNFSEVRLTRNKTQTVSAWLSPKPAVDKNYAVQVTGNYADYITVGPLNDEGEMTFGKDGVPSTIDIALAADLPTDVTDGYILGEVVIGSGGCQPATIYVRYAKEERLLKEIVFLKKELKLEVGKTYQLEPVLKPKNATDTELKWTIDNTDVATVENGLITALEPGEATITAAAVHGDATASVKLTVYSAAGSQGYDVQVGQIKADPAEPDALLEWQPDANHHQTLLVTGQHKLELTLVSKDNGVLPSEPIRWKSNRSSIATFVVEENGKEKQVSSVTIKQTATDSPNKAVLQIKGPGTATITATGVNSGEHFNFTLKAQVQKIEDIELSYRNFYDTGDYIAVPRFLEDEPDAAVPLELAVDRRLQLKVDLLPSDTTDRKVTWKTSTAKVAKVDRNNVLVATGAGDAIITAQVKQTVERNTKTPDGGTTTTEDTDTDDSKKEHLVTFAFKVHVVDGDDLDSITVTPCNEKGTITEEGAVIVKLEDSKRFDNRTGDGEAGNPHPFILPAGGTKYFLVKNGSELTESAKIKWKATRSGYLTVKQKTLDTGDVLLTVKGTTSVSRIKEHDLVRLVATNVGEFPTEVISPDLPSGNYPEIFFKIEAAAPESIQIKNVPKLLEIGHSWELGVTMKPKRSDQRVKWSISDSDIAQIDEDTGVITGLKTGTATVWVASVKDPNIKAQAEILVGYKVSSAKLNATSVKLAQGETFQLLVSVLPYQAQEAYEEIGQITFAAADDHIAYVDGDGVVHLYETAQPGEKTTIYVYIGAPENPLKKLKCKVQVVENATEDPTAEELEKVVVTTKTPDITLQPGSNKKLSYVISGLSSAQKSRVKVDWVPILGDGADAGVTVDQVIRKDDLGVVSVVENPMWNQAQVKATFWYVKHNADGTDGERIQLTTKQEPEVDGREENTLLYTININPALVVSVDGGEAVSKPDTIYIKDGFDGITLEALLTPAAGANISWTTNKTFDRYLLLTPAEDNPNMQTVTLRGERPDKEVTVSLKLKSDVVKKTITVKFKIYPDE